MDRVYRVFDFGCLICDLKLSAVNRKSKIENLKIPILPILSTPVNCSLLKGRAADKPCPYK